METNTTTVVLADDHQIVLDGVTEILKTISGVQLVGQAVSGPELLALVDRTRPAVVITDINMPVKDGIQCTREIKARYPLTRVLMLTMYHSRALVEDMIRAGADGCVLKSNGSQQLREALKRVAAGQSYFDHLPEAAATEISAEGMLSPREIEIIKLACGGKRSAEIAEKLFISEHTVRTHRKNIFRKLKIKTQTDLANYALARGWIGGE